MSRNIRTAVYMFKGYYFAGAALCIALLVLTGISLFLTEPGTQSHTLSVVNLFVVSVALLLTGSAWYWCERYETTRSEKPE